MPATLEAGAILRGLQLLGLQGMYACLSRQLHFGYRPFSRFQRPCFAAHLLWVWLLSWAKDFLPVAGILQIQTYPYKANYSSAFQAASSEQLLTDHCYSGDSSRRFLAAMQASNKLIDWTTNGGQRLRRSAANSASLSSNHRRR
jgi:hypothetical protein